MFEKKYYRIIFTMSGIKKKAVIFWIKKQYLFKMKENNFFKTEQKQAWHDCQTKNLA